MAGWVGRNGIGLDWIGLDWIALMTAWCGVACCKLYLSMVDPLPYIVGNCELPGYHSSRGYKLYEGGCMACAMCNVHVQCAMCNVQCARRRMVLHSHDDE